MLCKYNFVFVPFIGIDNHKRYVTFCARLLIKEDVESYLWLLENFKKAMGHEPYKYMGHENFKKVLEQLKAIPPTPDRYFRYVQCTHN